MTPPAPKKNIGSTAVERINAPEKLPAIKGQKSQVIPADTAVEISETELASKPETSLVPVDLQGNEDLFSELGLVETQRTQVALAPRTYKKLSPEDLDPNNPNSVYSKIRDWVLHVKREVADLKAYESDPVRNPLSIHDRARIKYTITENNSFDHVAAVEKFLSTINPKDYESIVADIQRENPVQKILDKIPAVRKIEDLEDEAGDLKGAKWKDAGEKGTTRQISRMPFALLQNPVILEDSSINPPLVGMFFQEMQIPVPNGMKYLDPDKEQEAAANGVQDISTYWDEDGESTYISYPLERETGTAIPMAPGWDIVAATDDNYLMKADKKNPLLTYNADYIENPEDFEYVIKRNPESIRNLDPVKFSPSKEEQIYWRKAMPLPKVLHEYIKENPEELESVIASYMAKEFPYIMNDFLGDFIIKHSKDLPLIMDELKMGHCDLLSWAEAVYLRSYGLPAFVVSGRITTEAGDKFIKTPGHSKVGLIKNGTVLFHDPANSSPMASNYNPDKLTEPVIEKLDQAYSAAKSESDKRDILRKLLLSHPKKDIENKSHKDYCPATKESANTDSNKVFSSSGKRNPADYYNPTVRAIKSKDIYDRLTLDDEITLANLDELELHEENDIFAGFWESLERPESSGGRNMLAKFYRFLAKHKAYTLAEKDFMVFNDVLSGKGFNQIFKNGLWRFDPSLKLDFKSPRAISNRYVASLGAFLGESATEDRVQDDVEFKPYFSDILINNVSKDFKFRKSFKDYVNSVEPKDLRGTIIINNREVSNLSHYLATNGMLGNRSATEFFVQVPIFMQLATRALDDKALREKLINDFGLDEEYFKKFADHLLKIAKTPKEESKSMKAWTSSLGPSIKPLSEYIKIFKPDSRSQGKAMDAFRKLLNTMDSNTARQRHIPDGHKTRDYNPGDDTRKIDWKAYGRSDKYYVRVPEITTGKSDPLHVYLDTESIQTNEGGYHGHLSNLIAIIRVLQRDVKSSGRRVYLTSPYVETYLEIPSDEKKAPLIAAAMICQKGNMERFDYDPSGKEAIEMKTQRGYPEYFIFLSPSDGKALALKHQLPKGSNAVCMSYRDAGIECFDQLKDSWVSNGL